uniref:interleukin-13 receptor subunit alpha-1-like n=1 Tax=Semicossyphus pulcher TaxID=241346 RepID=UPI0037E93F66
MFSRSCLQYVTSCFFFLPKCECEDTQLTDHTQRRDRRRLVMKRFTVTPVLWASLLVLWSSQTETCRYVTETEANSADVCQDAGYPGDLSPWNSSVQGHYVEKDAIVDTNFLCVLYPTNILNCSWWFHNLQNDTQLSVSISICDDETTVHSLNQVSEERVQSMSLTLCEHESLNVVLLFNITLRDRWTVYTYVFDMLMLEVLSPPQNISASFKDGGLLVTWSLPHSRESLKPSCFEYQLDLGDQESLTHLKDKLFHMEPNADQSHSYRVRIRTRQAADCQENSKWSEWSNTVTAERTDKLSFLVIISISLGIPMILLALLLLVRYQRVSEVLFPPIPHPPQKYKNFLEKNDTFTFFHPTPSAEPGEEITEVEDAEQIPGKTF